MSRPKKPGGTGRGLPLVGIRLESELLDWLEKHTKMVLTTKTDFIRELIYTEKCRVESDLIRLRGKYSEQIDNGGIIGKIDLCKYRIDELRYEISKLEKYRIEAEKKSAHAAYATEGGSFKGTQAEIRYYNNKIYLASRDIIFLKSVINNILDGIREYGPEYDDFGFSESAKPEPPTVPSDDDRFDFSSKPQTVPKDDDDVPF